MKASDTVGHLEEEALKRKERLRKLKSGSANDDKDNEKSDDNLKIVLPKPQFRSYVPSDEALKEQVLPKAKPESVENQVSEHLSVAKEKPVLDEVDLTSLAPRKVDWDLKRNLQKKLDKLEKRTQRAIAELIRTRVREASAPDLVTATQDLESTEKADDSDDD